MHYTKNARNEFFGIFLSQNEFLTSTYLFSLYSFI